MEKFWPDQLWRLLVTDRQAKFINRKFNQIKPNFLNSVILSLLFWKIKE